MTNRRRRIDRNHLMAISGASSVLFPLTNRHPNPLSHSPIPTLTPARPAVPILRSLAVPHDYSVLLLRRASSFNLQHEAWVHESSQVHVQPEEGDIRGEAIVGFGEKRVMVIVARNRDLR